MGYAGAVVLQRKRISQALSMGKDERDMHWGVGGRAY